MSHPGVILQTIPAKSGMQPCLLGRPLFPGGSLCKMPPVVKSVFRSQLAFSLQVCVEFEGLVPNQEYTFTLPSGTRYNDLAGPLRESVTFTFRSRLPFTIPLRDSDSLTATTYDQARFRGVSSSTLRLALFHGIAEEPANRDIPSRVTLVSMGPAFGGGASDGSSAVQYNFTISNRFVAVPACGE